MSKYDLRSACAVISGASSGIGFEIARILCGKYDCTVIGLARNGENSSLVARFASPADSAARKTVRRLRRGRKKIVTGIDAHLMSGGNRIFGTGALKIFAFFIRKVKLPIFKDTFYKR